MLLACAWLSDARARDSASDDSICLMIESAARDHGLPFEFFARVIWQESRFRADAVGPMTRSGKRAQGMAQFMPGTAAERGLLDPFDPVQALPKSAEFLKELWLQFGNLGLAAAAYNAGPRRVREWLAGTGYMPGETRNYVSSITGITVDDWAAARAKMHDGKEKPKDEQKKQPGCGELMAMLKRSPNPFLEQLTQRVVHSLAQPWGVQLGAGFSRDRAMAMYARALRRYESILKDRDPGLQSSVMRTRGRAVFYQVRIGTDTRGEANALCNTLRKAGGACLVLRNRG
ncbi:MAG: transglycosylase SLT domain-containing protein [Pseudorhodoplanes sp.]|uniref:transglycosylase SLT domain-containing protein n=1 Tax=Pseudorhodoplanes sp. TaxID=1934341 RepID=UPI003D0EB413